MLPTYLVEQPCCHLVGHFKVALPTRGDEGAPPEVHFVWRNGIVEVNGERHGDWSNTHWLAVCWCAGIGFPLNDGGVIRAIGLRVDVPLGTQHTRVHRGAEATTVCGDWL